MSDNQQMATYRILDASTNRAGEGLRSLEEYARFVLDDADVTAEVKSLRHMLTTAMARFPQSRMLAARDTDRDVGTSLQQPTEYSRTGLGDVVAAAASRTQQSLRVLEEYGKTIDPTAAAEIEQIRYRCYTVCATLQKRASDSLGAEQARAQRMADAQLYVLVDAGPNEQTFADSVRSLLDGGVDVLQLRDRNVDDRTLISRGRIATGIARERQCLFIMNDRADLALACDADGVHVGQDELPASVARQILGPERLVGVSTHSIDQALEAVSDGADYIGCGPVFPGNTKSFDDYVGTDLLCEVSDRIMIPAFAIGGIDAGNLPKVTDAGFFRIAVTGAVRDASDPRTAANQLKRELVATLSGRPRR